MIPLASSLIAHQQGPHRLPAIEAIATRSRFGIPVLDFVPGFDSPETEYPHAAAFAPDGTFIQVSNRNGNLDVRLDFGSWTTVSTSPAPGDPVAIAATSTEVTILCGEGAALTRYHSTDSGGSWTVAATIVTEASAVTAVALGANPAGNLCGFYVLNGTGEVKRIRRTSGTWAASGTTWPNTSAWDGISGIAAVRNGGLFNVIVTGVEASSLRPTVAAYAMGDGALPSNVWFGPEHVLQADAASTISSGAPFIAAIGGIPFATFSASQSADVAYAGRTWLTHGIESTGLSPWREPTPLGLAGFHGAAIAVGAALGVVVANLSASRFAAEGEDLDLSDALTALSWRTTSASSRAKLRFQLSAASLPAVLGELAAGNGVTVALGYHSGSGGAAQYGLTVNFAIERVTTAVAGGEATLALDVIGPWETLDEWRSPQAWQAPTGTTRGEIFAYLAGRAGLAVELGAGSYAPSDAWSNHEPAFAIAAGEPGGSVLQRLLAPTSDFLRCEEPFLVVGLDPDQPPVYDYGVGHPIAEAITMSEAAPNWFRVQGPGRYADAFNEREGSAVGPRLRTLRELSATSDALAQEYAAAALARVRSLVPRAQITVPANVGHQLYDPITVTFEPLGLANAEYRVIAIDLDYLRGRSGAPVFAQTLTLGDL